MADEQISFIPKKTFTAPMEREGLGLLNNLAFILLVLSALVAGGLFFYKKTVASEVDAAAEILKKDQAAFEIPLINKIIDTSDQIEMAKVLLAEHKTVRPIFDFLNEYTSKDVSYTNFKYTLSESGDPEVDLNGLADGYGALSLQVNAFETNKSIKKSSFTGIGIAERGIVKFSAKLVFDPLIISFSAQE